MKEGYMQYIYIYVICNKKDENEKYSNTVSLVNKSLKKGVCR